MIAQERAPLTIFRDGRRAPKDLNHIVNPSIFERHIDALHDREMKPHVEFISIPKIRTNIFRPLIGFA